MEKVGHSVILVDENCIKNYTKTRTYTFVAS